MAGWTLLGRRSVHFIVMQLVALYFEVVSPIFTAVAFYFEVSGGISLQGTGSLCTCKAAGWILLWNRILWRCVRLHFMVSLEVDIYCEMASWILLLSIRLNFIVR